MTATRLQPAQYLHARDPVPVSVTARMRSFAEVMLFVRCGEQNETHVVRPGTVAGTEHPFLARPTTRPSAILPSCLANRWCRWNGGI